MSRLHHGHSGNMPKLSKPTITSNLPKVTLITCGYKDIKQTYQNIDHIIIEDVSPPTAFTEGFKSSQNPFCCFLDQYSDFASEHTVEAIMKIFLDYPEFGGVYTDNIINDNRQYYPSYMYTTLQNIVINTPFICRKETNVEFIESPIYYYEALKKIGQLTILHHIPEALFTMATNAKSN